MRKKLFFLFLCIPVIAFAQQFTITGKVTDANNQPLTGAYVLINGTPNGAVTNNEGNFKLVLNKETYQLVISYVGFETKTIIIDVTKNTFLNIVLQNATAVLDEVLVAAIRATNSIPVTYSNLSKKEIAKRNLGQDIPILMNYLPNVVSSSDAGNGIGYTYMSVRGSNGERINVTINGIPYNDAESHGTFWVNLGDFASSTENLQLQRGVGTSTNGASAFGASLNILTDAVSEDAYGEISNTFGSFNSRKHTVKFSTGKLNNHFELSGRLSNIYSDGYVDRAFTDLKSYFLQGTYTDKNTLLKAITFGGKENTYQAWFGLDATQLAQNRRQNPYTYDNEVDDYGQDHYQLHWNEKLNENWSTNLGLNYTKGEGFFEQFQDDTDEISLYNGIILPSDFRIDEDEFGNLINVPITDLIRRRWLDNDFYVFNLNTNYAKNDLNIITGISYAHYIGDHFGEVIWAKSFATNSNIRDRYYFSDAKKTDFSLFVKSTFNLAKKLNAYIDLQGRFVGYQTAGLTSDRIPINVDAHFNFFNPKFGFTYTLNSSNNLYASFAVANREPNRNDFENGVSTPETLHDYEFGWRFLGENTKLNTNIYYMNYQNQLVLTGALDGVGAPIRATSGSSYRLGLEIDADITLSNKLNIKPNLSISTNKNRNFVSEIDGNLQNLGNTNISFSPNVVFGNTITYAFSNDIQIAFLSKFVGEQYLSNLNSAVSNIDVLPGFFTSDLNFVYQIVPKSIFKSITFTAVINNIFNNLYEDRGYYYTYDDTWSNPGVTTTLDGAGFYPQAGTNFLIGATLRF